MRWDEHLDGLLDDLEQQAEGLALAERDALVAEQRRAEYAAVDLSGRLHASVGDALRLDVRGVGRVDGSLRRVGDGWCLLEAAGPSGGAEWLVRLDAVLSVRGLSERSHAPDARPVTARLGLGSALRGVAGTRAEVLVHRVDGTPVRAVLGRVGADFVALDDGGGRPEVLPFSALAAVRRSGPR